MLCSSSRQQCSAMLNPNTGISISHSQRDSDHANDPDLPVSTAHYSTVSPEQDVKNVSVIKTNASCERRLTISVRLIDSSDSFTASHLTLRVTASLNSSPSAQHQSVAIFSH